MPITLTAPSSFQESSWVGFSGTTDDVFLEPGVDLKQLSVFDPKFDEDYYMYVNERKINSTKLTAKSWLVNE